MKKYILFFVFVLLFVSNVYSQGRYGSPAWKIVNGKVVVTFNNIDAITVDSSGDLVIGGNLEIGGNLSVAGTESKEGEMYWNDNSTATTMETANTPLAIIFATTGQENGFTFDAGSTGGITAYSDGGGGTVDVADVAHGLVTGDIVAIRGTTNYNGVFEVTLIDADNFTITDTWVNDNGASDWEEGSYLQLTAGTSEVFEVDYNFSVQKAAGSSSAVIIKAYIDATAQNKSIAEITIAGTDIENPGSGEIFTMSAGDRLWFSVTSSTTNNLTFKYGNVRVVQQ